MTGCSVILVEANIYFILLPNRRNHLPINVLLMSKCHGTNPEWIIIKVMTVNRSLNSRSGMPFWPKSKHNKTIIRAFECVCAVTISRCSQWNWNHYTHSDYSELMNCAKQKKKPRVSQIIDLDFSFFSPLHRCPLHSLVWQDIKKSEALHLILVYEFWMNELEVGWDLINNDVAGRTAHVLGSWWSIVGQFL